MLPILLLHGILDGPDAWSRVAPLLEAAGRRVILHDARHLVTPQEVALDAAPHLPAHVVGHSRGATAASWLAVEDPDRVASLAVVASPPHATEAFRATFRRRIPRAGGPEDRAALTYLAQIPDDAFPAEALRRYRGRALVVEYEDDPLYSPTHTMFWRMFLPYAEFHRVPGGHRAFAEDKAAAAWLAQCIMAHVAAAEG
ncbi:MAG TPA: alpha/beta fold hydrolase [Candidatus Thermoplasmatota archaeon]|nr:alpha/beta fold hydrolase [Candidatus Thermoplasmatota archaeon]